MELESTQFSARVLASVTSELSMQMQFEMVGSLPLENNCNSEYLESTSYFPDTGLSLLITLTHLTL